MEEWDDFEESEGESVALILTGEARFEEMTSSTRAFLEHFMGFEKTFVMSVDSFVNDGDASKDMQLHASEMNDSAKDQDDQRVSAIRRNGDTVPRS